MERTVLKCSLGLILNNFYNKSWSRNRPLKGLIHADTDDDELQDSWATSELPSLCKSIVELIHDSRYPNLISHHYLTAKTKTKTEYFTIPVWEFHDFTRPFWRWSLYSQRNTSTGPFVSYLSPFHISRNYFCEIHFNIILPSISV
jgi:hypothetical protein